MLLTRSAQLLVPYPRVLLMLAALLCLPRDAHSLHHPALGAWRDLSSSPVSPAVDSSSEPPAGGSTSELALSEAAANRVLSCYMCHSAAADEGGCETLSRHFELSSLLPPPNSKTLLFGQSCMNEVARAIMAAGQQETPSTFSFTSISEDGSPPEECYCGLAEYHQVKPCACGYQARVTLGDNATIYNVYNKRHVQGGSSSEISNLRALLDDLRGEGFTHALVMEPHPQCWFDDPNHVGTDCDKERSHYGCGWAEEFWSIFTEYFGHNLVHVVPWSVPADDPLIGGSATGGAKGVAQFRLLEHFEAAPCTAGKVGGDGWRTNVSHGEPAMSGGLPHQCLWVVDEASAVIRPAALVGATAALVAGLSDDKERYKHSGMNL